MSKWFSEKNGGRSKGSDGFVEMDC